MLRSWLFVVLLCGLLPARLPAQASAPPSAGDEVCASCHVQTGTYVHTAHHATSAIATDAALKPVFQAAGEKLTITSTPLPTLAFAMKIRNGHFAEIAQSGWPGNLSEVSEPVDVIVGSGKRGQTYLYWDRDRLFELPVSYWREGQRWINSPGYVDGTADFHRPVQPGCLECHATSIVPLSADATTNSYDRASLIPGIGCQICHGAGAAHVKAEREAALKGGKASDAAILNPAHFTRDRQIDLCALCHSGIQRTAVAPAFSYVPGEALAKFYAPTAGSGQDRPDVHGNQVGLLERSRCFAASGTMTCSTCHDVHSKGQPVAEYAQRCLSCHQWQSCGESHRLGAAIKTQCIGCHMPVQPTNAIVSETAGERVQASMRTHWIKVYAKDVAARR